MPAVIKNKVKTIPITKDVNQSKKSQKKEKKKNFIKVEKTKDSAEDESLEIVQEKKPALISNNAPKSKKNKKMRHLLPAKNRGVVFLRSIPHGFYEEQMRQYFSQFGTVTRVRVVRSRRTGKSKGYAFVEFQVPEVAKIAAETMDNYLMFKKNLKTSYIPPEEQKFNYFATSVRSYTVDGETKYTSSEIRRREKFMKHFNAKIDEAQYANRLARFDEQIKKLQDKYGEFGITINPVVMKQKIKQIIKKSKSDKRQPKGISAAATSSSNGVPDVSSSESEIDDDKIDVDEVSDGDDNDVEDGGKLNITSELEQSVEEENDDDDDEGEDDSEMEIHEDDSANDSDDGSDLSDEDDDDDDEEEEDDESSEEEPTPPPSPPKKKSKKAAAPDGFEKLIKKKDFGGIQKKKVMLRNPVALAKAPNNKSELLKKNKKAK